LLLVPVFSFGLILAVFAFIVEGSTGVFVA
jgi:hypothetical protein